MIGARCLDNRNLELYVLDVSGHGVSAALMSAQLSLLLSSDGLLPVNIRGFNLKLAGSWVAMTTEVRLDSEIGGRDTARDFESDLDLGGDEIIPTVAFDLGVNDISVFLWACF